MHLKDQLAEAMRRRNVRTRCLAASLGVSSQTVRNWLAGKSAPRRRRLSTVEGILEVRLDLSEGASSQLATGEAKLLYAYPELMTLAKMDIEHRDALFYIVRAVAGADASAASIIISEALSAALNVCKRQPHTSKHIPSRPGAV